MLHHLDDNLAHGASRLRTFTPENMREDLELHTQGVLDWRSLVSGYQFHNHPVEATVTDSRGELKFIRRQHNLRTNKGGLDQASVMSDPSNTPTKGNYIALATLPITPNDQDTFLGGWAGNGSQAEETAASLARQLAAYSLTTAPGGTTGSTAQGTYRLTATWTNIQATKTIYGCGVFGGPTVGTPGSDLWFEAALSASIGISTGDNLTLTYTINY